MKPMIMKFKQLAVMISIVLLATNCSKDEEVLQQWQGGVYKLTASVEEQARSTMTDMGIFSWVKGDSISVWNDMPEGGVDGFVKFVFADGNNFNIDPKAGVPSIKPANYAVYPAGAHAYTDDAVTIHLPNAYGNAEENYVANTRAPMLAIVVSGKSHLNFKHVGGVMRFIVQNVPAGANEFVFTAADKNITGNFIVDEGIISAVDKTDKNSLTIRFKTLDKVAESMTFYVPLPVGTYTAYTVSIKGENGLMLSCEDTQSQNTINRRSLLLMPTLVCKENALTKGVQKLNFVIPEDGTEPTASVSGNTVEVDTENPGENAVLNLNYTPNKNQAILNLLDTSMEPQATASKATVRLFVPANANVSVLNLEVPTLTMELSTAENGSATYEIVSALTALNSLKIKKGITIKKLILKGGNVVIEEGATVESIENREGFNHTVYAIKRGVLSKDAPKNVKFVSSENEMEIRTAAEYGGQATLMADLQLSEPLVVAGKAIIDLNGHVIKPSGTSLTKVLDTNDALVLVRREGSLTICDTAEEGGGRIDNGNNQSIWGAIKLTDTQDAGEETAELVVQGGAIKGYYYGIVGNGKRHGTNITISGGTVETGYCAEDNVGIYHPQNGTMTITDGAISGYNSAVEMRSGTLVIEGGNFTATATSASAEANGEGTTIKGAAIAVSQHATNEPLSVTVNGGTFTGQYALYEEDKQDETITDISMSINGGTFAGKVFSKDCKEFITNGTFTDASAFVYVANKSSLTLGDDINLTEPLLISQEVAVDLNGKSIVSKGSVFEVAGGKLSIGGEGNVKAGLEGEKGTCNAVYANDNATVTITGGNYYVDGQERNDCIYAANGSVVTISGGTFESKYAADQGDGLQHWILNTKEADAEVAKSTITVQGGTFVNFNPANNVSDGKDTNYVASGYEVRVDGEVTVNLHDAANEGDTRTEYKVVKTE